METSAVFRQNNQILYSAKILRGAEAKQDFSAGWGEALSTGPCDVLDLNADGKANFRTEEMPGTDNGHILRMEEPAIVSPSLDKLETFAKSKGAEVLTQGDLPEGVYISDRAVAAKSDSAPSQALDTPFRPLNVLVNDLPEKFDPNARFALDFATGELLIYKPAPGGVVANMVTTPSGLEYGIAREGQGEPVKPGQLAAMRYTGWLENGKQFDSNVGGNRPFVFQIGAGKVIKGWDEGVAGMKAGEVRKLVIPPQLGYGQRGAGQDIPPNATLIFQVELLAFQDPQPTPPT